MAKRKAKAVPKLPLLLIRPPEPPPDLSRFTEATRSAIYSYVYSVTFTESFVMGGMLDTGVEYPLLASERAELTVFCSFGRWFGAWRDTDMDKHLPLEHREVLSIVVYEPRFRRRFFSFHPQTQLQR